MTADEGAGVLSDAERCDATFPCHPTPEWPCDDPKGDHRCALRAGHHGGHVTPGGWR